MKKSVTFGWKVVICPCCESRLVIDATVRVKGEPQQTTTLDEVADMAAEVEGAEPHG